MKVLMPLVSLHLFYKINSIRMKEGCKISELYICIGNAYTMIKSVQVTRAGSEDLLLLP